MQSTGITAYAFPTVLGLRVRDGLPLNTRDRIGAAAAERYYLVLNVAGIRARRLPVDGHGRASWNSRLTVAERCSLAAAGSEMQTSAATAAARQKVIRPYLEMSSR
jgi:hypothetical protein